MTQLDLAVNGGTLISGGGRARVHVGVTDGRVVSLGAIPPKARHTVDATGLLVLPGMVDTHVHLMDPGATDRENFPSGSAAAATAGTTTLVEHTHGWPVRTPEDLAEKRAHLKGRSHVDYGLAAHAWPDRTALSDVAALWQAGVTFFKIFTCTTHGIPGFDPAHLQQMLDSLGTLQAPCLMHCEDESLTAGAEKILRGAGRDDPAVIMEWRSREAELVAVAVAALLVRLSGARATVAHVSSPDVAELIARERAAGADLWAETCPQYLFLREDELLEHGAFRKFTPPARARTDADEDRMWQLLRTGVLTHLSTDHAPATRAQKQEGSIWDVHFGLPGLDTTVPLLVDAALRGKLALEDVVRLHAERPARRYGLWPCKGSLRPGADADMVLIDPSVKRVLTDEQVRSMAGWTPYAGREVQGTGIATYLRGQLIVEADTLVGERRGRYLPGPGCDVPR